MSEPTADRACVHKALKDNVAIEKVRASRALALARQDAAIHVAEEEKKVDAILFAGC